MPFELDAHEARVLGCLIEKEMATPDYYPLSLNALVNACNQKSSRDPHMSLGEDEVTVALDKLRHRGMAFILSGGEHRVPKHGHRLVERLNIGNRELALLACLLLRGPQTLGELRGRTQSLYAFDDLDTVEMVLRKMADRPEDPLVAPISNRWGHLLSGPVTDLPPASAASLRGRDPVGPPLHEIQENLEELKARVARLEEEMAQLRGLLS